MAVSSGTVQVVMPAMGDSVAEGTVLEWRKQEAEVNAVVDWRITADPALRTAFRGAMTDGFALGPAVPATVPVASGCAEAIAP